ncbi:enoyl-CoA hydratase/isomerase family protein [Stenotrophobium rhamnosiphilum]|uniref:Enoyl-CoA hydratase/isomerase family protein n=1 Tax=Stenotrophobium rhamnosiphilum TaxID=2029166 RepID=A0A2T5ME93_9GAMM|nr:enoyl-CoA hydratase/isomerase family protein [Stenotrophobium rhamnosiphilum]PTU30877.1 enoyl-CoA hydratase/isomerase family protein [Stenotrophobium rhamnosiphilum]
MKLNFQHLQTAQQERVLTVALSNPPFNFLTSAMMAELDQLLREIENDTGIGAVILTSAVPDVFLTHFDVGEIKQMAAGLAAPIPSSVTRVVSRAEAALDHVPGVRKLIERTPMGGVSAMNLFHEVTARMKAMDKVFIAAINGRAMGGGCELTLACDLRLMVDGSVEGGQVIGQPEIYIGLIPGGGGTQMLTRILGVARALEFCLDGTLLSPREAYELGLINRVVPADELMSEAMILAERMARRSADAVRAIKRSVYQAASQNIDAGMEIEKAEFMSVATQKDTRYAMTAYADYVGDLIASGKQIAVQDFESWQNGTAVNFNR